MVAFTFPMKLMTRIMRDRLFPWTRGGLKISFSHQIYRKLWMKAIVLAMSLPHNETFRRMNAKLFIGKVDGFAIALSRIYANWILGNVFMWLSICVRCKSRNEIRSLHWQPFECAGFHEQFIGKFIGKRFFRQILRENVHRAIDSGNLLLRGASSAATTETSLNSISYYRKHPSLFFHRDLAHAIHQSVA